jgi:NADH-quinone oxidoreductase subunit J
VALPDTVPYLGWRWDDLAFLALAGVLLGGALMVVLGRDIIRSGLWLILSFAGLAGIYVLLGAPLVAAAQVLIYIGAIAVLILFAIMLTQTKGGPVRLVFQRQWWAAAIAAVVLCALLLSSVLFTSWPLATLEVAAQGAREIARLAFTDYLFAFEVVGLLMLAAVIGGIYVARRDRPEPSTTALLERGAASIAEEP